MEYSLESGDNELTLKAAQISPTPTVGGQNGAFTEVFIKFESCQQIEEAATERFDQQSSGDRRGWAAATAR